MDRQISPQKRPRWPYFIGAGIFLLVLFAFFYPSISSNSLKVDSKTLMIKEVSHSPFQEFISADGVVQPERTVIIDALVSGKVVSRLIENGSILKSGEPILILENIDLQLDILNKETAVLDLINNIRQTQINLELNSSNRQKELTDAQYQLVEAQRLHSINEQLWKQEVISKSEFEASRNQFLFQEEKQGLLRSIKIQDSISSEEQLRQMKTSLLQANKNLELMKSKLKDLTVRAPIDGQLSNFDLEEGQLINVGENIGQIDAQTGFKIRAQVDQYYLNRIVRGQKGSIKVNETEYELEVSRIYPSVSNNFFAIDLAFTEDENNSLTRGQNLIVKIELGQTRESVVIPKGSFYQSTGGQWVFVLDQSGNTAYRRDVKLGKQNPEYFEVLEGLEPGDRVITSSYNGFEEYTELNF